MIPLTRGESSSDFYCSCIPAATSLPRSHFVLNKSLVITRTTSTSFTPDWSIPVGYLIQPLIPSVQALPTCVKIRPQIPHPVASSLRSTGHSRLSHHSKPQYVGPCLWLQQGQAQDDTDADSALGDGAESSTASISSSILQYRTIHGRSYHSEQGNAQYWCVFKCRLLRSDI